MTSFHRHQQQVQLLISVLYGTELVKELSEEQFKLREAVKIAINDPEFGLDLVELAYHHRSARDLLLNNPLLASLSLYRLNHLPLRDLGQIMERKQQDILEELGLVATRSAARVLRKCRVKELDLDALSQITALMTDPAQLDAYRHCDSVEVPCLRAWDAYPWLRTHPLMPRFVQGEYEAGKMYIEDILRMNPDSTESIIRTRNMHELKQLHDRMAAAQWQLANAVRRDSEGVPLPFPPPPLPGNQHITAVLSARELRAVGKKMRHCVYSYCAQIQGGEYYVYQYHRDNESATIGLSIDNQGKTRVAEVQGKDNTLPPANVRAFIRQWHEKYSQNLERPAGQTQSSS